MTRDKINRVRGVLVGTAAGDALGAGYEFGPPLDEGKRVTMRGGGIFRWEPGEWTDDTSMAIAVAAVAATRDLRSEAAQDELVRIWANWARSAKDVGAQTRSVLRGATNAKRTRIMAYMEHIRTGKSGGNGSLMRTAPVALAFLSDPEGLTEAAIAISELTHFDPEAAEACVIWSHAIRHAVLTGQLDAYVGLSYLAPMRASLWHERLKVAELMLPRDFTRNGWVVEALQAAWCAICLTPSTEPLATHLHVQEALKAAVRGGKDTDTVAAITGGLLGAAYGERAVPLAWRKKLHGWPRFDAAMLGGLAEEVVK